jgi:micrococcal nuclease
MLHSWIHQFRLGFSYFDYHSYVNPPLKASHLSFFVCLFMSLPTLLMAKSVSQIYINDSLQEVRWNDGDSFKILSGKLKGQRARLMGYNTLESYGPVHKWKEWSAWGLYKMAKDARKIAIQKTWHCKAKDERDHYGRMLLRCPDLIAAMISSGYGHLFEVLSKPDPKHVVLQQKAIADKKGMWAKGAPKYLVSSIHSTSENQTKQAYNRIVNLKTGSADKALHTKEYKTCEWVCVKEGESCMLYVPFKQRYGDVKPSCLKWSR